MKIWFLEVGEPLPTEKHARLHRYGLLTKSLARGGHDITWWTSTFVHSTKRHEFDSDVDTTVDGVRIRALHGPGYQRNVSLQRIWHQRHFAKQFTAVAVREPQPDILVAPVPTLEGADAARRYAVSRNLPFVVDIRDQWPAEFVEVAPNPMRPLVRVMLTPMFRQLRRICTQASGVLAVSHAQLNYGLKYANRPAGANDGVFPLGYPRLELDQEAIDWAASWWKNLGVDPTVPVFSFFGTIGRYFNFDTVINAAANLLASGTRCQFVICGTGSELEHVRQKAVNMPEIIFPGWVDAPRIVALMRISCAGLAPYSGGGGMSLPNKPFEYFAGALPVISSIQGELTELLARESCGLTYAASSVDELTQALTYIIADPRRAKEMGTRGRALYQREFTTDIIHAKFQAHLLKVIASHEPSRRGRHEHQ